MRQRGGWSEEQSNRCGRVLAVVTQARGDLTDAGPMQEADGRSASGHHHAAHQHCPREAVERRAEDSQQASSATRHAGGSAFPSSLNTTSRPPTLPPV